LKNLFGVQHVVAVGRYPFQKELAARMGAQHVFTSRGSKLVEEVAAMTGAELYTPDRGSKWTVEGVDGVIDTIGAAETIEAGLRFLTTQGRLVFTGVDTPKRCENTPHYFKELEIIGSNSFSTERYRGGTAHAFEFFLEFVRDGKLDPAALLTHKFPLERYAEAFDALAGKGGSNAVKAAFAFA
jgi:threonine dehydrogenase-like Zn-dependent dehydrogenase